MEIYLGHDVTYGDVLDLNAGQFVDILGTNGWSNPYQGLPRGAYTLSSLHCVVLGMDNAKVWWQGTRNKLAYGMKFTEYDGFFIEFSDNGPLMLAYPKNLGTQKYHTEVEIVSDDAQKTVGVLKLTFVLKLTLEQNYEYENTRNGFPDTDLISVYDEKYTGYRFQTVLCDTLVSYKYAADVPFKVRNHYIYSGATENAMGGDIIIEVNPDRIKEWINEDLIGQKGGFIDYEYEVTADVDWIVPDKDNDLEDTWKYGEEEGGFGFFQQYWRFTVTPNYELYPRVGYVTVKMKGSDYQETVRVVQQGGNYADVNEETHHFDYRGGTFSIKGRTNWPGKVVANWGVDWIKRLSTSRGLSDYELGPLYVEENTSPEPRTATITVFGGKYLNGTLGYITVTQEGRPASASRSVASDIGRTDWGKVFKQDTHALFPWRIRR